MPAALTISGKQLGSKRSLYPDRKVPYPPFLHEQQGATTLRELIGHVVTDEVRAFRERQEEWRLFRVLTERQITAGAALGKIDPAGHEHVQDVVVETAVSTAIQAFADGLYFVFINGHQETELDSPVRIEPDSTVTFVRLVALAGG